MIDTGFDRKEEWISGIAHQAHRFARDAKAAFHLWTDRVIINVLAQSLYQPVVVLVSTIITHFMPQEAGADPKQRFFLHSYSPVMILIKISWIRKKAHKGSLRAKPADRKAALNKGSEGFHQFFIDI
jgi:hypothetical protein